MNKTVAINREKLVSKLIKLIPEPEIYKQLKEEGSYFVNGKNNKIYSQLDWYKEYIIKPKNNNELVEDEIIKINDNIL